MPNTYFQKKELCELKKMSNLKLLFSSSSSSINVAVNAAAR